MADSVSQSESKASACTLAKSLAPEDVRLGDYVSPLHEVYDFASFLWGCDDALEDRAQTVPVRFVAEGSGVPLKVKAVCLPFVLVKHPTHGAYTLDVRRHQLARLDKTYAKRAWQALQPSTSKSKRKKRRK